MRFIKNKLFMCMLCFLIACTNQDSTSTLAPTKINTISPSAISTSHPIRESIDQEIISPNGLLVAKKYYDSPSSINNTRIEIQDTKGSLLWKIPFEGVILNSDGSVWVKIPAQGEQWKGEPNPSLYILEWSQDNEYLYFHYGIFVDGYQPLIDKFDLRRINIKTGFIETVISGVGAMDFSFSPNQGFLVYTRYQDIPRSITVRNTITGEEKSISLTPKWDRNIQIGGFHWSPYNSNEIRFHTFGEDWESIQVYFLDVNIMSPIFLFEYTREEIWYDSWLPSNILRYITYPEKEITEIDIAIPTPRIIGTATPTP